MLQQYFTVFVGFEDIKEIYPWADNKPFTCIVRHTSETAGQLDSVGNVGRFSLPILRIIANGKIRM